MPTPGDYAGIAEERRRRQRRHRCPPDAPPETPVPTPVRITYIVQLMIRSPVITT
jgi:hypothetical protein